MEHHSTENEQRPRICHVHIARKLKILSKKATHKNFCNTKYKTNMIVFGIYLTSQFWIRKKRTRSVFDAAAMTNGISFNDMLLEEP